MYIHKGVETGGEGGGKGLRERRPVLDETQFPDQIFTPLFPRALHFVTVHTARDLTISYSSTPLEKPMKFASRRDSRRRIVDSLWPVAA